MNKKIVIVGPVFSRSGYGEMARFAYRSLSRLETCDLYIMSTNWGNTSNLVDDAVERKQLEELVVKTQKYIQESSNNPNFDIALQISIPNEWKKVAAVNIGYTAGIETNIISPAWLQPSQLMDKIIVISEHAKTSFVNTVFGDDKGNSYKVTTPVEVCHFPTKDVDPVDINLDLKHDFNFLAVCQWGPRKNLEQTIINFIEEFKKEEVGLVLKVNMSNDSHMDREVVQARLEELVSSAGEKKCTVTLIHGYMTDAEMSALYKHPKIKAVVSTTHGEGFGFPLFEAACNELPVVATDWSGHLDFLTMKDEDGAEKKMFAKVDYELKQIAKEHAWKGVLEENSGWAYPLAGSFKNRMREVYKNYGRFKSWAKKLNVWLRNEFTEEKIFTKFNNLVNQKTSIEDMISLEDL